ncbi:MAG: transposase [Anaerolineaceae bacterium]
MQGVSTRKVKAITEELCGVEISAMQVSRAAAQLDGVLQEWRERSLGEIPYLYVDALYEKVREAGQVRDAAVLVASGITPEVKGKFLGSLYRSVSMKPTGGPSSRALRIVD